MLKGTIFSGQPVFAQLTGMINRSTFATLVKEHDADRYCKRCKSWEHLIFMLYCIMNNCTSLREVTHGIAAYGDKLNHSGLTYTPPRSTLSDANVTRSKKFFGALYQKLTCGTRKFYRTANRTRNYSSDCFSSTAQLSASLKPL
jgi:hypothetical protein